MDALSRLGTVTAGAIVGILIRESFAWGRDKWVERKNSIRGSYETSTEPRRSGAPARIASRAARGR